MNEGKIVGLGTHEDLLQTNAIYQEVYESQTREVGHASNA
jgi:ATP-binding cassette subfamily B protein